MIINENIEKVDYECKVDLVAITVTVDVLYRAAIISDRFREQGVCVVAGGIHITADPESARLYFDTLCVGRAEGTWLPMLQDKERGKIKKVYIDDLQNRRICSPNYDIPENGKYIYTNIVSTSRGCPYRCDFCYNSCKNATPYLNRPVSDVLQDILSINRRHILFIDDNFIGNPKWTFQLLTALLPYDLKWSAAVSANILDHMELLDLMERSGCQSLFIGFETLHQGSIDAMHKSQNRIGRYATIVQELHRRGIMVNASIVFGLPDDNPDVFDETLKWMVKHRVETVTAHILTPYPGTALHKRMTDEKKITDSNLSHYNTAHVVFQPENMSAEELYKGYIGFYKKLYSFRNIIKRIPKNKKQRAAFLFFNLLYRKFGRVSQLISKMIPLNLLGGFSAKVSYRLK